MPRPARSSLALQFLSAVSLATALVSPGATGQTTDDRMAWWREARFGLFVHWGLYAIPAGSWESGHGHGGGIYTSAKIPLDRYRQFQSEFNPTQFDARAWAKLARRAGMKYLVITSKHHDGFALFDSKVSDWDVMNTPFRRDIMKEIVEACRAEEVVPCFYHSIMDWHYPDYLPRRDWETRSPVGAQFPRFVDYLHAQVEELLTNYGPLGVIWFDGEWESTWTHEHGVALFDHCRRLQPSIIINNRVDKGRAGMAGMTTDSKFSGDFGTPEQEVPARGFPGGEWESCMTMNRHWGFNRADQDWKSAEELVRTLCDVASKGGNFLLNVGPTAEGLIPAASVERLETIGRWMDLHAPAIHGTTASPFERLSFGRCTQRAGEPTTTLYLHVFDWPKDGRFFLPGLQNAAKSARLLANPERTFRTSNASDGVTLATDEPAPSGLIPVIEVEIAGIPRIKPGLRPAVVRPKDAPPLLRARYAGTFERLPDFGRLSPIGSDRPKNIEVPTEEHVATRYSGYLMIPEDATWEFALTSDDGSRLRIDGEVVIDHDGLHEAKELRGTATLQRGLHHVEVEHFNRTGRAVLMLQFGRPGQPLRPTHEADWQ